MATFKAATTSGTSVYADIAYAPYGESYAPSGASDFSFTGQNNDTISDLYDFTFREYHAGQGRWIAPDPAGLAAVNPMNPQTWNRYAYVGGGPLSNVDPLGLCKGGGTSDFAPHDPGAITVNVSAPCPKGPVDEVGIDDAIGNGPGGDSPCTVGMGIVSANLFACPIEQQQRHEKTLVDRTPTVKNVLNPDSTQCKAGQHCTDAYKRCMTGVVYKATAVGFAQGFAGGPAELNEAFHILSMNRSAIAATASVDIAGYYALDGAAAATVGTLASEVVIPAAVIGFVVWRSYEGANAAENYFDQNISQCNQF